MLRLASNYEPAGFQPKNAYGSQRPASGFGGLLARLARLGVLYLIPARGGKVGCENKNELLLLLASTV